MLNQFHSGVPELTLQTSALSDISSFNTKKPCCCEILFKFDSILFAFLYNLRRLGGGLRCFGGPEST